MGITDRIEAFICELTRDDDGWVEFGRNELAGIFNCVPSQINYVISTRFTPERGYVVESRRGGGGFIKIKRLEPNAGGVIARLPVKMTVTEAKSFINVCKSGGLIENKAATLMTAAVSSDGIDEMARAEIMKNMLAAAVSC